MNIDYYLSLVHRWLRYGTPNESFASQVSRIIIAIVLLFVEGIGIAILLKPVFSL